MRLQETIGSYFVSTVALPAPLGGYETMVFRIVDGDIDWSELYCDRASSENEARDAHEWACYLVMADRLPTKEN